MFGFRCLSYCWIAFLHPVIPPPMVPINNMVKYVRSQIYGIRFAYGMMTQEITSITAPLTAPAIRRPVIAPPLRAVIHAYTMAPKIIAVTIDPAIDGEPNASQNSCAKKAPPIDPAITPTTPTALRLVSKLPHPCCLVKVKKDTPPWRKPSLPAQALEPGRPEGSLQSAGIDTFENSLRPFSEPLLGPCRLLPRPNVALLVGQYASRHTFLHAVRLQSPVPDCRSARLFVRHSLLRRSDYAQRTYSDQRSSSPAIGLARPAFHSLDIRCASATCDGSMRAASASRRLAASEP